MCREELVKEGTLKVQGKVREKEKRWVRAGHRKA